MSELKVVPQPGVEARRVLVVLQAITAGSAFKFQKLISVPFTPHEVIVRQCMFTDQNNNAMFTISSQSLVPFAALALVADANATITAGLEITHKVAQDFREGTYEFDLLDKNGKPYTVTGNSTFGITLEFVRYRK